MTRRIQETYNQVGMAQLWIDAESSEDAVPSKYGTGIDVLRMHCTTEVYVFIM